MAERSARRGLVHVVASVIAVSLALEKKGWVITGASNAEEGDQVVVGGRKFTHY